MNAIEECAAMRAELEAAGVSIKYYVSNPGSWLIEAEFSDRNGVGDLASLTSAEEVRAFVGAFCPSCWTIDRRRTGGGECTACARANA